MATSKKRATLLDFLGGGGEGQEVKMEIHVVWAEGSSKMVSAALKTELREFTYVVQL